MPKAATIIGSGLRLGLLGVGVVALAIGAFVYDHQRKAAAAEAAFWSMEGLVAPPLNGQLTVRQAIADAIRVGHMSPIRRPGGAGGGGGRNGALRGDQAVRDEGPPVGVARATPSPTSPHPGPCCSVRGQS